MQILRAADFGVDGLVVFGEGHVGEDCVLVRTCQPEVLLL